MSTHLVTGFPGFIGRRLVAALLADDAEARIVALVEGRMAEPARAAAAEIDGERIEVIPGDIATRRLGLADADYERLAAEVGVVHHLAAIYDLAVPEEIAQKVNVEGTGNVLDFCADVEGLSRLNYVSTAYVAGTRTGVVYEHELALGQGFKNHYESTKFQAEVWVRDRMDEIPTTIYRPGIVVGDSKTGETQKFDGPYYVLRFVAASVDRHMPIANIGRGKTPFNVVPVDFIVDSMVALGRLEEAVGETVHLCDPEPLTSHEMVEVLAQLYAGRKPSYRLPPRGVSGALHVRAVRNLYGGTPSESIRYMNHPVRYDTRRATELLASSGLRCPRFPEYAPAMVEFFRRHEDDPAFHKQ
ncbi:MAG: SDR family oxidoreductase [Solirubrobacterales bacterium]|nr:SDR family oxidoreductase [Solirubrobacterales bacterium]MCB8969293.1 SDR family oxidoreductase [Thermoleophilales bacterium]MCO5328115.1 SDR family oxidoreductase [Solirubrobacterales bacterium]